MTPTITLTHFLRGPMQVRIAETHTWMIGSRQWTDVNSDGRIYDDGAFEEKRDQIDEILAKAMADARRIEASVKGCMQFTADRVREEMATPDAE